MTGNNEALLRLLGLARKAGKLEVGEEPVGAACRARHAKLLVVAADAAPNTFRRARHFGEAGNVLWLTLPCTKAELGGVLGRSTCALAAVMDSGFAASLAKKLAQADPEQYGAAAEQLSGKAAKVLQRQREKRQHEKNLREGKRKPWVAPPKEAPRLQEGAQKPSPAGKEASRPGRPRPKGTFRIVKRGDQVPGAK